MPWFEHEFDRKKLQKNCAKKLHFRKLHRKSRWAVKIILDEAFVLRKILKMQWNIYGIDIFSHRKVTFWGFYYYKSAKKCFTVKKVPTIMPLWANFLQRLFHRIYSCKLTYICTLLSRTFTALQFFVILKSSYV